MNLSKSTRKTICAAIFAVALLGFGCDGSADDPSKIGQRRRVGAATMDEQQRLNNAPPSNPTAPSHQSAMAKNPLAPRKLNPYFVQNLPANIQSSATKDPVLSRILSDYGAIFVARGGVSPPTVMFADESECLAWQSKIPVQRETVGGVTIELQAPAMKALLAACSEAQAAGLDITPRGAEAARRSYRETIDLWLSRVNPALDYWSQKGRLTAQQVARIRSLKPPEQVPEVLALENEGIFFSKDFSKSILYSVAAPGTSQHLSMLAIDIEQFENPKVRSILSKYGWFQTVSSDLPHFTFLGVKEDELQLMGLRKSIANGRLFWIP